MTADSRMRETHGTAPTASEAGESAGLPLGPVVKVCGLTRVDDVVAASRAGAWALGFIFASSPRRLTALEARSLLDEAGKELAGPAARKEARYGSPEAAEGGRAAGGGTTTTRHGPLAVGVFVDHGPEHIAALVRDVGLDAVQLHGSSAPTVDSVRNALRGVFPARRLATRAFDREAGEEREGRPRDLREVLIIKAVGVPVDEPSTAALRDVMREAAAEGALVLIDSSVAGRTGGTGRTLPWDLVAEAATGVRFLLAGGIDPVNVREALAVSGAWGVDVSSGIEAAPGVKDPRALLNLMAEVEIVRAGARQQALLAQEGSKQ